MAESIESFVAKLQAEGVQAGKQQADKIRAEAEKQAQQIIAEAEKQAQKIIADAKAQAENLRARTDSDLQLACRDAILRLQEKLAQTVQAVLSRAVERQLSDVQFIGNLLTEIIRTYTQSDTHRDGPISINVSPDMRDQLVDWAIQQMGREAVDSAHESIDLKGTLAEAGFEYRVSDGTVEFTTSSVVEVLMDMAEPSLREMLNKAVRDKE